ncbi:hypothetical protein PCANC_14367 [Puccinia coronata f. sp. avenae]|uniref:Uncharacterized protein n=1 Tax=Puccinia coronata f. sp. avenae TaxID=200324 RepID=A0A2N5V9I5_9BASI|nr:hypothetical protein PCANC_14367 [Puccinia coronata f. sp. avenae]
MTPTPKDQLDAFAKIQQAIREDDLWLAAWLMARFTRRLEYTLNPDQLKWLQDEHTRRQNEVRQACSALEKNAQEDAREDFHQWLNMASPFQPIVDTSWMKHTSSPKLLELRESVAIYSRAAGYLSKIINLAHNRPHKNAPDEVQLEAMGSTPSDNPILLAILEDEEWIVIQKQEAQQGDYYGSQWSTLLQSIQP